MLIGVLLAAPPGAKAAAGSPEVWLSGVPPFVREQTFHESDSDYMDLFKPDAPWSKSAQVVGVFMVNGALVMHQSDDELKAVFSDLRRRNIALAIEMGLLSAKDSKGQQVCGVGVEGFAAPDNATVVADRIQKAGGVLAYVAMDESLWYAHQARERDPQRQFRCGARTPFSFDLRAIAGSKKRKSKPKQIWIAPGHSRRHA